MNSLKFDFRNRSGEILSGRLEIPDGPVRAYALFAHCFTCNKNVHAATRISRALCERGFAVLRFDFTGLGSSEGDFANTNFSSNLDDLRAAIDALRERHQAPQILVGHSLGGAAVLYLASEIPSINLVASIGAPSQPSHVLHLFGEHIEKIEQRGATEVEVGGRRWSIQQQFIDDVTQVSLTRRLNDSNVPVLIFHAPEDRIVDVENAKKIYMAANHPKSFVSLDGANHLLTNKTDSQYVADVLATWATRYIPTPAESTESKMVAKDGRVVVKERNRSFTQDLVARSHHVVADEPTNVNGDDLGMTPYELLLSSLGACTAMTLRMYAKRKGIDLEHITVELEHDRIHVDDCKTCEEQSAKVDRIRKFIKLEGDITEAQHERMLEIAEMCPVNRTLLNQKLVTSEAL